jgi:colicin import membrane protein
MNQEVVVKGTGIVRFDPIAAALSDLESRLKNVVHDVTTTDGMAVARKDRAEVRRYRVALEKARVDEKAEALEYGRKVDSTARQITGALLALEEPIDIQIKNEESRKEREKEEREMKEAARIAGVQQAIADLNAIAPAMVGKPSATIAGALDELKRYLVGEWAFEFKDLAQAAKDKAVATLEQLLAGAIAQEDAAKAGAERIAAERAELARLRAEQDERNRQEQARRVEQQRQEGEARAKIEAQGRAHREKIEAEEKASREKIEAEQRAARLAREEADRKAREEQAKRNAEIESKERAARLAREEEDKKSREEARLVREAQDKRDAEIKAERERLEAAQREVEAKRNELLDGEAMLRRFVERFGKRREFAAVVKAIGAHLSRKNVEAEQAELR